MKKGEGQDPLNLADKIIKQCAGPQTRVVSSPLEHDVLEGGGGFSRGRRAGAGSCWLCSNTRHNLSSGRGGSVTTAVLLGGQFNYCQTSKVSQPSSYNITMVAQPVNISCRTWLLPSTFIYFLDGIKASSPCLYPSLKVYPNDTTYSSFKSQGFTAILILTRTIS